MNPLDDIHKIDEEKKEILIAKDSSNDDLTSKLFILKNKSQRVFSIPKWAMVLLLLFLLTLLIILLAAIILNFTSKRPGLYLENCKSRSCETTLGLKCIDSFCQCENDKYYLKKCEPKKDYYENCQLHLQCKSNMICVAGKCQCEKLYYWNGDTCLRRYTHNETCEDGQCLLNTFLFCDNATKLCTCESTR